MPEVRPVCALHYTEAAGSTESVLAPPYDVIDPAQAAELRTRSPWNCVRLILPEGPDASRYTLASDRLQAWIRDGILERDTAPAIYAYRQVFSDAETGQPVVRTGMLAAVRLTPFSNGEVLAHEQTHAGPKRDRLALTIACRTQLSPVFLLARDPAGRLNELLGQATDGQPTLVGETPDGIVHRLWRVSNPRLENALCAAAGDGALLVADGHHRYETALAASEVLSNLVKARYILAYIVSGDDPGLRVRPTHRVLTRRTEAAAARSSWREWLSDDFDILSLGVYRPGTEAASEPQSGRYMTMFDPADGLLFRLESRPESCDREGISPTGRHIASVLFDRLIVRRGFGLDAEGAAAQGLLSYHRASEDAIRTACAKRGPSGATAAAFLLPAVPLADVWAESEGGVRLPPKTTCFEPKVPCGLIFRPLTAHPDRIDSPSSGETSRI